MNVQLLSLMSSIGSIPNRLGISINAKESTIGCGNREKAAESASNVSHVE